MITFVYRTGFKNRKNGDHYKPARLNAAEKKSVSSCDRAAEVWPSDDTHLKQSSGLYSDLYYAGRNGTAERDSVFDGYREYVKAKRH